MVTLGALLIAASILAAVYARGRYITLDCRDGQHSACATCWCACHSKEAVDER